MHIPPIRPVRAAALLTAALLAACGGDGPTPPPPPPPALTIAVEGRQERGGELTFSVTVSGAAVPAAEAAWTYTPAAAVEVLGPGRVRLLAAGTLQVGAAARGSEGTRSVVVAAPPVVVFDMLAGENRDLYRVDLDGQNLQRLTTDAADDASPAAGASVIVFVSYRAGNAELFSMPVAGGAATRLTSTGGSEGAPALSPDGQRLAFTFDGTGVAKVFTADGSSQNRTPAAPGFGFGGSPETSPTWHPMANRIAFVGTANGSSDIFQVIPGTTPTLVVGGPNQEVDPAWSPDGSRIAFASDRDGDPAVFSVVVMTGEVTRLSQRAGTEAEPSWTNDGRLVYVEFLGGGVTRLVWIDPADPAEVHPIPVAGSPRRPSVVP